MKTRFLASILIIVLGFIGLCPYAISNANSKKQVILVDMPRFDLAEVSPKYPHLWQLISGSATGLVTFSVTTPPLTPDQVYLYFASGESLKTPLDGYRICDGDEPIHGIAAGRFYESLTGNKASAANGVNLDIAAIRKLNKDIDSSGMNYLGSILHRQRLQTAAIGNSDSDDPSRLGAVMAMDAEGLIDYSAVGTKTLRQDGDVPFGIRSDPDQIHKYYQLFKTKAALLVMTLGDLERVESFQKYLSDSRKEYFRRLALQHYDEFLGRLLPEIDFTTTQLVIFSCMPPDKSTIDTTGLTALSIKGPGFRSGVLYSPTTRRAGILTYNDLRQHIVQFLTANPGPNTTSALRSIQGKWQDIATTQTQLVQNYSIRWPLLTGYGVLLIGLTLALILGLCFGFTPRILRGMSLGFLFLLAIPAVFLMEALVNPLNGLVIVALALGLGSILFILAYRVSGGDLFKILAGLSFITAGTILMDGLWNGHNELLSFLGYSAVSGGRFYGIGNEYLGVLLGSLIVGISLQLHRIRQTRWEIFWIALAVLSLLLFHPNFGAKIGGGLTALLGLGITIGLWFKRPLSWKEIGRLLVAALVALILTGVWDFYINKNAMSHFGQLLLGVRENGIGVFGIMVIRKLALNWRLIQYTPLTLVLIGILVAVPFLTKFSPAPLHKLIPKYPDIASGFTGLCITGLIALFLNDTGIAAAATMFIYGAALVLVTLVADRIGSGKAVITKEISADEK